MNTDCTLWKITLGRNPKQIGQTHLDFLSRSVMVLDLCVVLSVATDVQTGPVIASVFGVLFLLAFLASPVYGLAAVVLKRYQMRSM